MASPTDAGSQRTASLGGIALTDRTGPRAQAAEHESARRVGRGLSGFRAAHLRRRPTDVDLDVPDGEELRRLTLGRFPTLGLPAAREKATDALRDVGKGQDPG